MKKMIWLLVAACSALMPAAFAAQERGNGGDVILCADGRAIFYDLYEMEKLHHLTPQIPAGANWQEISGQVIDRFQGINPSRAYRFRQRLATFLKEAEFLSDVEMIDIPDTGIGFFPQGCKLHQLAIQKVPRVPGEKRYLVNQDIWQRLDEVNRAALVVHELILGDAIEDNHPTSESTRYLNALVLANQLGNYNTRTYIDLLRQLDFYTADYNGVSIGLWKRYGARREDQVVWRDGRLVSASLPRQFFLQQEGAIGTAYCPDTPSQPKLEFYPDGRLIGVDLRDCTQRQISARVDLPGFKALLPAMELVFFHRPALGGRFRLNTFGHVEIQSDLLRINYTGSLAGEFGYSLDKDEPFQILRIASVNEGRCLPLGEAFIRDAWRKVQYLDVHSGKIVKWAVCDALSMNVGGQTVSVLGMYSLDAGGDGYSLAAPQEFPFKGMRLLVERLETNKAGAIVVGFLGEDKKFKRGGKTYACRSGTSFDVVKGAVDMNSLLKYCSEEAPRDQRSF